MTDTIKYSLGILGIILLLFLFNLNTQKSHKLNSKIIFDGNRDDIYRIVLSENDKLIELVRQDTTWVITQADSFSIKENQIDKIFDRLLAVEQEILITTKNEKWEKFGVDDSLGRHIKIFDKEDNEQLHYVFGNSGQDWQHNYIRKHGANDVYRTNDNVYFLLNTNTTYWGTKPPEPVLNEQNDQKEE